MASVGMLWQIRGLIPSNEHRRLHKLSGLPRRLTHNIEPVSILGASAKVRIS
jgi:hypothetical protein